jgi:threonyl-tRNA synthetase
MRRLGSQEQRSMSLDEALGALTAEAVPPDLRPAPARETIVEARRDLELDGRHVVPETVA